MSLQDEFNVLSAEVATIMADIDTCRNFQQKYGFSLFASQISELTMLRTVKETRMNELRMALDFVPIIRPVSTAT